MWAGVCQGRLGSSNNHTSHPGLKLPGRKCSMHCLEAGNSGYRAWVEAGRPGMGLRPTRSSRAFSETKSGHQGEECHFGLNCFKGAPSQTGKGVCPPRTGRSRLYPWVRKGHLKFWIIQTSLDFRISGTKPALRNSARTDSCSHLPSLLDIERL